MSVQHPTSCHHVSPSLPPSRWELMDSKMHWHTGTWWLRMWILIASNQRSSNPALIYSLVAALSSVLHGLASSHCFHAACTVMWSLRLAVTAVYVEIQKQRWDWGFHHTSLVLLMRGQDWRRSSCSRVPFETQVLLTWGGEPWTRAGCET